MKGTSSPVRNKKSQEISESSRDADKTQIEELEKKLKDMEEEVIELRDMYLEISQRLRQCRARNEQLIEEVNMLELMDLEMKLKEYQDMQEKYPKIKHRCQVTKKLLDQTRDELKIREKIIKDMENRGFMDYILRRYPESLLNYRNRPEKDKKLFQ